MILQKQGATFIGWYYDEDLTSPVTWPITLDQDYTLYAKWEAVVVVNQTITFDSMGGSSLLIITSQQGSSVEKPNDPTKNRGYLYWLVL